MKQGVDQTNRPWQGQEARMARSRWADRLFTAAAYLGAASPVVVLAAVLLLVTWEALPSIRWMGWQFLTSPVWSFGNMYGAMVVRHGVTAPAGASYGALVFLVGTLASSALALLLAVPFSTLAALVLAYRVHGILRTILSISFELLAGVPSVVIGLWGLTVLVPWVRTCLGPWLTHVGGWIPLLRGPVGAGMGWLTSSLVLALMIIPIITATTRDLFVQVPDLCREGGLALGMTSWEVVRHIALPAIREGWIGAIALGWGRAMGETMAVLMVSGSALNVLPHTLFSPISTVASVIADQLDGALTDASHMALHALAELALVLLVMTMATNWVARMLVRRNWARKTSAVGVETGGMQA